ncbi:MAG: SpoIIE family protein phosphatase [Candidatus Eisenbacteria bacterium]|nr:SpoIIE family protein phosphatase [Candidatus Eisenbacteria bacterium]
MELSAHVARAWDGRERRRRERRKSLETQGAFLLSLIEASKILNSTLDLDELLKLITEIATNRTNADRGSIFLLDREKGELWARAALGEEIEDVRFPVSCGIAGYVARTGDSVFVKDAYSDPRFYKKFDELSGYRTRSLLCIPLRNRKGEIIGSFELVNKEAGAFTSEDRRFLEGLSTHAALALENARLHKESLERERLQHEISLASRIQKRLLPAGAPEIPGYEIFIFSKPCDEVGGDYYDFLFLDNSAVGIALGDVTGHGVPAALLMSNLQALLKTVSRSQKTVSKIAEETSSLLFECTDPGNFATLFLGVLDPEKETITYSNAGQNPPVLARSTGEIELLTEGGIPLGVLGDVKFVERTIRLEKGDSLVIFTDGVVEKTNSDGEEFGDDRLLDIVKNSVKNNASETGNKISENLAGFSPGSVESDDITFLVLKHI